MTPSQPQYITNHKVFSYLHWFIPKELINDTRLRRHKLSGEVDLEDTNLALVILGVYIVSMISMVGNAIYLLTLAETPELKRAVIYVATTAVSGLLLSLFVFKYRFSRVSFLSNAYSFFSMANMVGISMLMGFSLYSPNVPVYIFLPVWAFLTCGPKSGVVWVAVCLSIFFTMMTNSTMQWMTFPNIVSAESIQSVTLLSWGMAFALMGLCLHAYQSNFLTLTDSLNQDRVQFAHKASHDALTGLPNRLLFENRLKGALNDIQGRSAGAALMYIDLNDFKMVNDNYGHQVGDKVLTIVANRLRKIVRDQDTAARLGGDEFGIVLGDISDQTAVNRIGKDIERAMAKPMQIGDISIRISGSVGIAMAPEQGEDIFTLTKHADKSMYRAKDKKPQSVVTKIA